MAEIEKSIKRRGELKTKEMCLAAVQQNGKALKYVPKELRVQVKKSAAKLQVNCKKEELLKPCRMRTN
jgi:hypothetical protein